MIRALLAGVALVFVLSPVHAAKPDKTNGKGGGALPPGLQKKVERGGQLPPGWEKKLQKGSVMEAAVYAHARPVPDSISVKLPPAPEGAITVKVEGKVVRLMEATRTILDVFDIH